MTHHPPLPVTSPYTLKDQRKWDQAEKFIGRGSSRSSTEQYRQALGALANSGVYAPGMRVFVSAEGNRSGRIDPDLAELERAASVGAHFITDIPADRHRPYNLGERQVEQFLTRRGYVEVRPGEWEPGPELARQIAPF